MGIGTWSDAVWYPGCASRVTEPFVCPNYPLFQQLAKQLQEVEPEPGKGCSIVQGQMYCGATAQTVRYAVCGQE